MKLLLSFTGGGAACRNKRNKNFLKKEFFSKLKLNNFHIPLKKAFSIAEAMITLLIVSVVMAATAPILSKRAIQDDSRVISNNLKNSLVPSGMLAYFDGNCPTGWTNMGSKGWGGRFLRVAGYDNTLKVNTPHGQWQDQQVGYHEHTLDPDIRSVNTNYGGGGGPYSVVLSGDVTYYNWWSTSTRKVKAIGSGGNETRPNNIALNLCKKD